MNSEKGLGMYSLASDVTNMCLIPQMHIIYLRIYFAWLPTEWFITFMHLYYVKFAGGAMPRGRDCQTCVKIG